MHGKPIAFLLLAAFALPIAPAPYRSKSKSSAPTYDQKQTGDYNIQLHLKDFQVVALLNDGLFGDFGDYDYNYDYSDITIKPTVSITTTTTTPVAITSSKPEELGTTKQPPSPNTTQTTVTTSTQTPPVTTVAPKTTPVQNGSTQHVFNGEQIIPVQVISAMRSDEKDERPAIKNGQESLQIVKHTDNLTVVDKDQSSGDVQPRKCALGFTRDKQGRCRRVRRPTGQLPFGITHLASLASKFRQATNDQQPAVPAAE